MAEADLGPLTAGSPAPLSEHGRRGPARRWPKLVLVAAVVVIAAATVIVASRSGNSPPAAGPVGAGPGTTGPMTSSGAAAISAGGELVSVRPAADGRPDRNADVPLIAAVLTDLETFWGSHLPGGSTFQPPGGGYVAVAASAASISGGSALCITSPGQIAGNAFYCPVQDGIAIDSTTLVPVLLGHYGPGGLAASLAHEYGHAIQARIGPNESDRAADPARYPTLLIELQADCYSGSFLAWAEAGKAPHVKLSAAALPAAIGPLLDFHDTTLYKTGDPVAHGLGVDRLRAVLLGLRQGVDACHRMELTSLHPAQGRGGVKASGGTPRFASPAAVLMAARPSIEPLASQLFSEKVDAAKVEPAAADLTIAAQHGQFAAAAALAWAVGAAGYGNATGAACFTGAWTASVYGSSSGLGSWAGDPDEAMDLIRARPTVTLDQLAAFADGFDRGPSACH